MSDSECGMHDAPVHNAVMCAWGVYANACQVKLWSLCNRSIIHSLFKYRATLVDHSLAWTMEYGSFTVQCHGETICVALTSLPWGLLTSTVSHLLSYVLSSNIKANFNNLRGHWMGQRNSRIGMPKRRLQQPLSEMKSYKWLPSQNLPHSEVWQKKKQTLWYYT